MTSSPHVQPMVPMVKAIHDAGNDAQRAGVLLQTPFAIMLKYSHVIMDACSRARFEPGFDYCASIVALLHAVRNPDGSAPAMLADTHMTCRGALIAIAAHGTARDNSGASLDELQETRS